MGLKIPLASTYVVYIVRCLSKIKRTLDEFEGTLVEQANKGKLERSGSDSRCTISDRRKCKIVTNSF